MNLSNDILRVKERAKTRSTKITASTLQNNPLIFLEILKKVSVSQ